MMENTFGFMDAMQVICFVAIMWTASRLANAMGDTTQCFRYRLTALALLAIVAFVVAPLMWMNF